MADSSRREPTLSSGEAPPRGLRLAELLTVADQTDETGRLLLEDAAPPEAVEGAVAAGIDMESVEGAYDDPPSRRGAPVNLPAYEALRRDTGEVLSGFAWLAARHGELASVEPGTVEALAEISRLGITLPLVLFHQGHDPIPPHGALPSFVASLFKASRGVFSASFDMLNSQHPVTGPTTAADVIAFADREGHLRRAETDRACAAPTRLIQHTVDVVLAREEADVGRSQLPQLLPFELLWEFHKLERTFSRQLARYHTLLEQAQAGGARRRRDLFRQKVWLGTEKWSFGVLTEQFLEFATATQADLNHLLGRADGGPAVTFEDVLEAL
jgi:hypothetical protein